jgi:octaprenyl-diphosphate synthase
MFDAALDPIRAQLALSEEAMFAETRSGIEMADRAASYLSKNGGKRIRPVIFLLSSRVANGTHRSDAELARIAAAIELMHTASIMHDDVVDGADVRRGRASANNVWGEKASVLTGDFLWSVASGMIAEFGNLKLVAAMSECVKETTLGEILELSCRGRGEVDEETCLRIARGKTASLFSAAARAGAIVAGSSEDEELALADYGRLLGTAYQLMDDALDYASSREDLGKRPATDLSTGTPTYPFVAALRMASPDEAGVMRGVLESRDGTGLKEALPMIERLGGIGTTVGLAREYSKRARGCLERFEASTEKDSLLRLADFASNRRS